MAKTERPFPTPARGHAAATPPAAGAGPWRDRLLLAAIIAATWLAYWPALSAGFIWDDNAHVTRPELRSLHGLWRIWTDVHATQQYYPLLHSAFWAEHGIFGDNAAGYHFLNIALHSLNAGLLWWVLRRLRVPGALLAAGIFALHPVMVESVAWVTEQKNTLSGVFYFSAALAYLRFDTTRARRWYGLALGFFVLGLLCKTVIATLAGTLLVVAWWQRGKLEWRREVRPLVPFFALGGVAGLFTAWVERTLLGAEGADFSFTLVERGLIAGRAAWFYLGKIVWPTELVFIYPRWSVSQGAAWQYLFPAAAALALGALWLLRKRTRGPLAAVLVFGGTLFPVLGFFNVYPFLFSFVADHFQYLASASVVGALAAGATQLAAGWPRARLGLQALGLVLLAGLATLTWRQSSRYHDNETLFRRVLEKNPDCWLAHFNLGNECLHTGRAAEASDHFRAILRSRPDSAEAHNDLASALLQTGAYAEAVAESENAVRLKPGYAAAHDHLGTALLHLSRPAEAADHYTIALRLQPDDAVAEGDLALALQQLGRQDEAVAHFQAAIRLQPNDAEAHNGLGTALFTSGRAAEAIEHYETALRLRADYAEAHSNLSVALLQLGRLPEAIAQGEAAVRAKSGEARLHFNLGNALIQAGRIDAAIEAYQRALTLDPKYAEAHANLANALIQSNQPRAAVAHFRETLRLQPADVEVRTALGLVLLYLGETTEARAQLEEVLRRQPDYTPARDGLTRLRLGNPN